MPTSKNWPTFEKGKIRLGVGVFVRDSQGKLLLEKRKDCGLWCIPGGSLEAGESVAATAIREVKEETGMEVEVLDFVGIYSDPNERFVTYFDTGTSHLIDIVLRGKIISGNLRCSEESTEVGFFPESDLPPLLPRAKEPIADGFKNLRGVLR